jgi:hypothetical protein
VGGSIDRTPYCAAPACDLNLAGWAHVLWDCDAPMPAPTLGAETVARLPVWRRPWVQGSARAFARLNPGACPPRQPGEELPGELTAELTADPSQRTNLRDQEATATLGERAAAGLRAENLPADPARRRAAITDRARFARLHALDRELLLASLARLPADSPDLSARSTLDDRFYTFLLSDHPAAVAERCRRRAAYLDDTARRREVLHGWLAKLDATPARPGARFDDAVRRLAATTRTLLDRETAEFEGECGEPDAIRLARSRGQYETHRHARGHTSYRYPARWQGAAAARQLIPPKRPARAGRHARAGHHRAPRRGDGRER